MIVLGIETSCDETAAAVVEDGQIRSNVIWSQQEHSRYGGVVPEIASRAHMRKIVPSVEQALTEAGVALPGVDGIAVTAGPGLVGSLLIGISTAKAMALALGSPLIGVHHLEGHLFSNLLVHPDLSPPFMALIASGGHTELILVRALGWYEGIGRTRDDAAGEAFDKTAKALGLIRPGGPTMGGPLISRLAEGGDPAAMAFPRGLMGSESYDFSFSGLKTAVIRYLRGLSPEETEARRADLAASVEAAICDVLVEKTLRAAIQRGVGRIALSGGVAANRRLRAQLGRRAAEKGIGLWYPPPILCTDNAAMIAAAGAFRLAAGERSGLDLRADPRLRLRSLAGADAQGDTGCHLFNRS